MRTATALLFFVFAVALIGTAAKKLEEHQRNICPETLGDICSKSTAPQDVALSVLGFLGSALMLLFPGWRMWCMYRGPEDVISDRLFMMFLLLGALDYAAWVGLAFGKCSYCDATPYVRGISIIGYVCNLCLSLIGLFLQKGRLTQGNDSAFATVFIWLGALFLSCAYCRAERWIEIYVALSLMAQLCRIMATDYSEFSKLQFGVSTIGAVCGFLCMKHPHMVFADPYWKSVYYVAFIRLGEAITWFVSYLGFGGNPRRLLDYALHKYM